MGINLKVSIVIKRLVLQSMVVNSQCHNFDIGYLNRRDLLCEMIESGNLLEMEIKTGEVSINMLQF